MDFLVLRIAALKMDSRIMHLPEVEKKEEVIQSVQHNQRSPASLDPGPNFSFLLPDLTT